MSTCVLKRSSAEFGRAARTREESAGHMSFLERVETIRTTLGIPEGSVAETLRAAVDFMGIPRKEGMTAPDVLAAPTTATSR